MAIIEFIVRWLSLECQEKFKDRRRQCSEGEVICDYAKELFRKCLGNYPEERTY